MYLHQHQFNNNTGFVLATTGKTHKSPMDTDNMNFSLGTSQLCDDTQRSISTPKKERHKKTKRKTSESSQQEFVNIKKIQTAAEFVNQFILKKSPIKTISDDIEANIKKSKHSQNSFKELLNSSPLKCPIENKNQRHKEQHATDFEEVPDIIEDSQPANISTFKFKENSNEINEFKDQTLIKNSISNLDSLETVVKSSSTKKEKNLLKSSDQDSQLLHEPNKSLFNDSTKNYFHEDAATHKSVSHTPSKKNKHRKHKNSNTEEIPDIIENSQLNKNSEQNFREPNKQNETPYNINIMQLNSSTVKTQDTPSKKNKQHKRHDLETKLSQNSQSSSMDMNASLHNMDEESSFYTQFKDEVHMKTSTQNLDIISTNYALNYQNSNSKEKKKRKHSKIPLHDQELVNLNTSKKSPISDVDGNTKMGLIELESSIEDLNYTLSTKKKKQQKDEIPLVLLTYHHLLQWTKTLANS
jgi:hypothetical protein